MDTYGVNASSVEPTGPQGLIVKGDILKYIEKENLKPLPCKKKQKTDYFYFISKN